jgi:hypothetical protein
VSPLDQQRWTFVVPTPVGDVHSSYDLTAEVHDAVGQLRTRSLYKAAAGIAVVCYVLYELLKLVF